MYTYLSQSMANIEDRVKILKKKAREGENTGTLEEQEQESGLSSLQTPYKQEENRVKYFKH